MPARGQDDQLFFAVGSAGRDARGRWAAIWPHSQGLPWAARPIITPAAPVWAMTAAAAAGIDIAIGEHPGKQVAATMAAMVSYSACPRNAQARLRPCTARAAIPASSAIGQC